MGYTINYMPEEGIVKIIIEGRINYTTAQQYSKEAIKDARDHKCSKFLFDHKETKLNKEMQQFYTDGDILQQFGFNEKDKIAVSINCKKDDDLLTEVQEENVNWSTIKYFNSSIKAAEWLLEDD